MRRSFIIIALVTLSMSTFSCTTSDISEDISIEELATEGDEGEILPEEKDGN